MADFDLIELKIWLRYKFSPLPILFLRCFSVDNDQ